MKFEDLTGKTFNDLKVIKRDATKKKTAWICECLICGKEVSVYAYNLKNGNSKNCGCKRDKETSQRSQKDLTGQTISNILIIDKAGTDSSGHLKFRCKCLLCGNLFEALGTNLLRGKIVSCGCQGEKNRENGRNKTLQESFEFSTNVGKIRSKKLSSNNKTGVKGVHFVKSRGYYQAKITFQGKTYILKTSKDIEQCINARKEAEKNLFGDFLKWYDNYKKEEK